MTVIEPCHIFGGSIPSRAFALGNLHAKPSFQRLIISASGINDFCRETGVVILNISDREVIVFEMLGEQTKE